MCSASGYKLYIYKFKYWLEQKLFQKSVLSGVYKVYPNWKKVYMYLCIIIYTLNTVVSYKP